jgi:antitoxin YefM
MNELTKTITLEQAQKSLKQVIDDIRQSKSPYVLTSAGEPQALIITIEEYEDLLEELALLSSAEHIERIAQARAAYQAGEGGDYDTLRQEILGQLEEDA